MKNNPSILFVFVLSVSACTNYNVVNKEPIFNDFKPETAEYKDKLAEIIQNNPDELTYIFNRYFQADGNDYLEITVNGDDTSATAMVLVTANREGIEGIIEKKGKGYGGAELYGLQLDIIKKPTGAQFIYKNVDLIID